MSKVRADYQGGGCPFDDDHDVEGGSLDFGCYDGVDDTRETVSQAVSCNECGAEWIDVYEWNRVIIQEGPETEHMYLGERHEGTRGDCKLCRPPKEEGGD